MARGKKGKALTERGKKVRQADIRRKNEIRQGCEVLTLCEACILIVRISSITVPPDVEMCLASSLLLILEALHLARKHAHIRDYLI